MEKFTEYDYKGKKYKVFFVERSKLAPCFGKAYSIGYALVREDLSPAIKRFVISHELYHLGDTHTWWGVFGRELRANLIPGFKDPIGLFATVWATISSRERMELYLDRVKKKY